MIIYFLSAHATVNNVSFVKVVAWQNTELLWQYKCSFWAHFVDIVHLAVLLGSAKRPILRNQIIKKLQFINHWIWEWIYREESWRRGPLSKAVSFDSELCGIAGLTVDFTVRSVVDRGRVQVSIASLSRAREAPLVPWLQFMRKSVHNIILTLVSWRIHTRWAAIIFSASYTEKPHRGHPLPSTGLDSFPGIKSTLKMWRQFWFYACLINLNLAVNLETYEILSSAYCPCSPDIRAGTDPVPPKP